MGQGEACFVYPLCELNIVETNTELSELVEGRRLNKDKLNQANSESKASDSTLGLRELSDKGLIRTVARTNKPSTNLRSSIELKAPGRFVTELGSARQI